MYNELNTVFSLSSLIMLALSGGQGQTKEAQQRTGQSRSVRENSRVKYFNPHSNSIASGLCSYKFKANKVVNRIPEVITEVFCDRPQSSCHRERMFHCVQERARLEVAYVQRSQGMLEVRRRRNITLNIGCSCAARKLRLVDLVSHGVSD